MCFLKLRGTVELLRVGDPLLSACPVSAEQPTPRATLTYLYRLGASPRRSLLSPCVSHGGPCISRTVFGARRRPGRCWRELREGGRSGQGRSWGEGRRHRPPIPARARCEDGEGLSTSEPRPAGPRARQVLTRRRGAARGRPGGQAGCAGFPQAPPPQAPEGRGEPGRAGGRGPGRRPRSHSRSGPSPRRSEGRGVCADGCPVS